MQRVSEQALGSITLGCYPGLTSRRMSRPKNEIPVCFGWSAEHTHTHARTHMHPVMHVPVTDNKSSWERRTFACARRCQSHWCRVDGLCLNAFINSIYIATNVRMLINVKRCRKERSRFIPLFCQEGLGKTTKELVKIMVKPAENLITISRMQVRITTSGPVLILYMCL